MADAVAQLLRGWLARQLEPDKLAWLDEQLEKLEADPSIRAVQIAFGMVPRRLGKDDLALGPDDYQAAAQARPGWNPVGWSVDIAARVLIMRLAGHKMNTFSDLFSSMCRYGDVAEAVALYRGLPLFPVPEQLEPQAGEGLRTNMRSIFEAIAHNNPYPREQFDENRWNHMVLKALFVDSKLDPIQGLDERANLELARILRDYAHERWAASRRVTPELWRCVGPYADAEALKDLERVIESGDANERRAAALALTSSKSAAAEELLKRLAPECADIADKRVTWSTLAQSL
jgi:hypothetical protein